MTTILSEIDENRVNDFILSLSRNIDNDIFKLKKYALSNNVPIISDDTKNLMTFVLQLLKPKKILEIGTAVGYSTLIMRKVCKNAYIETIEKYTPRIYEAKKNFYEFDNKYKNDKEYIAGSIKLIEMDATDYLKEYKNNEEFDFIFLDGAKAQYTNWLSDIKRLMKKNAILFADNIFRDGEIFESKFVIKKRNRTIHKRMRDFLKNISNDNELNTYILNIGDGVAISQKIGVYE